MKIALAQIKPISGDINQNIAYHKAIILEAIHNGAKAIFFPELSITGYEPHLANELKITHTDTRLDIFREISTKHQVTIGLGAPIRTNEETPEIALLIFQPQQEITSYSKQILHEDEYPFFKKGKHNTIIQIDQVKIAPAICYESLQKEHLKSAIDHGAEIYLALVAKPQRGISKAYTYFLQAAKQYNIPILMVNSTGFCDNFESVGQSAAWNEKGQLINKLDADVGILYVDI